MISSFRNDVFVTELFLNFLFGPLKNILEQKNDMIPTKGLDGLTGINESSGMTHPYVRVLETIFQNSSDQIHCGNCNEKFELKNFLSFWQVNFLLLLRTFQKLKKF